MTGSMIGADVDALRTLAAEFERDADRLSVLADGLGASLQSVHWAGADAARAREAWRTEGQPRIRAAADRLRQAAADLRWQAEEQGAASAAATASALAAGAMGALGAAGAVGHAGTAESGAVADLRAAADSGSPATVAAAWRKLSASERESLIRDDAGLVGNLDGVPASARDAANRARLDPERAALEEQRKELVAAKAGKAELAAVEAKIRSIDAIKETLELSDRHLLTLDLTQERAMAAVAIGDVDTAQNVVVFTPGLNSTVDGALARHDNDMRLVRQECLMSAPRSTTATVTWIGYQAPQSTADSLTDPHKSVVTDAAAHTGGHQLAQFVSGLDAARETDAHITALGHSYGSTTTAAAALELSRDGSTPIDDLVLFGSPGILTNDAADFGLDGGGTYVMEADRDPVADANAFGGDPQDADGVTNLAAWDSRGHSQYLSANGQNKYGDLMSRGNIAAVATGHPENAIEQPGGNHGSGDAARKAAPGLLGLAGPAGAVTGAAVGLNDFIRGRH